MITLILHEFAKGDAEHNVQVTCFLAINGVKKAPEHFTIPEKELPAAWVEDDLIVAIQKTEKYAELGVGSIERAEKLPEPEEAEEAEESES